mgnify:FL=1|jgi:twinkle protein
MVREYLLEHPPAKVQSRSICPICSADRTKSHDRSLSVKVDKGSAVYLCHHCEASGIVSLDLPKIVEVTAELDTIGAPEIKWFESRGISKDVVDRCSVVSGKVFIRARDAEVSCIGFSYKNLDGSVATKWRDGNKNFSQTGAARSLWRIEDWVSGDLVICEGEMDALACEQVGVFATSVPNGAPSSLSRDDSSQKYSYLWDARSQIDKAGRIILAMDSDEPGRLLSEEIARRIGKARCWRVVMPADCKDANDVLRKHGENELRDVLRAATPWPVYGLRSVSEYKDEVLSLYHRGLDQGLGIGLSEVDSIYKTCPQTLTLITGVPSSGKSTFLTWLSIQLAKKYDWSFAVLSAETPPRIHLLQMASIISQEPYEGPGQMSDDSLLDALNWLEDKCVILDDADTEIDSVLERAHAAVLRMGVRLLIIDPYNFLTGSLGSSGDDGSVANINKLLTALKTFSCQHGIAIWLVAHPIKMYRGNDGNIPTPTGYDISGSAAFYNVADAGLTVSRDGDSTLLTCWKARFPWIGKSGRVELAFDQKTCSFSSAINQWGVIADDDESWADID